MPEPTQQNQTREAASGIAERRVVIFSRSEDPDRMAEVLMDVLKLNRVDARIHIAHVPGVLPGRFSPETAAVLVEAIRKLGVSAAVVAQADIPSLLHPNVVHHLACLENGLEILGLRGQRTSFVPWSDLEFISVGHVPLEIAHHQTSEDNVVIHSAPHTFEEKHDTFAMSGPECWLIARHPQRIYFINHNQMNYDYLGDRKTGSATANFSELLKDIAHYTKTAFLTPATRAILHHGPANDYVFADTEKLKQATLVQYLLHRAIESQQSPPPQ